MQPTQQSTPQDVTRSNKKKLVWGLVCLMGPSALLVVSIIFFAVINLALGASGVGTDKMGPVQSIINVGLFLVGLISVLTWLPGLIVGIILLATRRPNA